MNTFKAMRNFDNFRKQITMKVFLPTWSLLPKCFFRSFGPDRQNVSRQHEGQQKKYSGGHDREHRPGSKNCWLGFSACFLPIAIWRKPRIYDFTSYNSFCGAGERSKEAKRKLELEWLEYGKQRLIHSNTSASIFLYSLNFRAKNGFLKTKVRNYSNRMQQNFAVLWSIRSLCTLLPPSNWLYKIFLRLASFHSVERELDSCTCI